MTEIGTTIRDIRLTERLGEGGMGEVFVGVHHKLGREVAVKVLRAESQLDATAKARFLREARILSALEHQNICRLYDLIEEGGNHYIVLELLRGRTLRQILNPHGTPEMHNRTETIPSDHPAVSDLGDDQRMQIAEQVAAALVAAHGLSVVHRDLKPENIMLLDDGIVKVLDFGIARRTETGERISDDQKPPQGPEGYTPPEGVTQLGDVLGTPKYLSPEQARGETVTAASDMYCFGLLLTELWTGRSPYGAGSGATELVRKASWGELDSPDGINPDVAGLIADLTRLSPSQRPTAAQAAERLRWIIAKPRRRAKRRAVIAVMAALAIAATASGLGYVSARHAQKRAESARAEAEAVNDFLREMLGSAAPEHLGIDVKVIDVLDDASVRVPQEFAGQPQTIATLQFTLGATYLSLGEWEKARTNLSAARDLFQEIQGENSRRVLQCRNLLGLILMSQGNLDEAEKMLRSTRERCIKVFGHEDTDTNKLSTNLGIVLRKLGRYDEAEPLFEEALAWKRRELGNEHPRTLMAQLNLANLERTLGNLDEAERMYREGIDAFRRTQGEDHPDTLASMSSFASFLIQERGLYDEGLALIDETLNSRRRVLGEEHPTTLSTIVKKARILRKLGRLAEAETLLIELLKTQKRIVGPEHPDTIETLSNLAMAISKQGRLQEAENLSRQVLDVNTRKLGPDHPRTLSAVGNLANLLVASGKADEAVELSRRLLDGFRTVYGEDNRRTLSAMTTLADALIAAGEIDEASQLAIVTLAKKREILGEDHPNTVNSRAIYAITLEQQGRLEEAEKEFRAVLEDRTRADGPDHYRTQEARANLVNILRRLDRQDEADALEEP